MKHSKAGSYKKTLQCLKREALERPSDALVRSNYQLFCKAKEKGKRADFFGGFEKKAAKVAKIKIASDTHDDSSSSSRILFSSKSR